MRVTRAYTVALSCGRCVVPDGSVIVTILELLGVVVFFWLEGAPSMDAVMLLVAWKVPGPGANLFAVAINCPGIARGGSDILTPI